MYGAAVRRRVDRPLLPHRPLRGGRHRRAAEDVGRVQGGGREADRPGREEVRHDPVRLAEAAYYWYPWLWQAGGELLSEDGKEIAFNSDAGKQAADFYVGLEVLAPRTTSTPTPTTAAWRSPTAGRHVRGRRLVRRRARRRVPEDRRQVGHRPAARGSAGCGTTIAGDNLVMFAERKKQDAAWIWIEFLVPAAPGASGRSRSRRHDAADAHAAARVAGAGREEAVLEGLRRGRWSAACSTVSNPNWPKIEEVLNEQLGKAIYGEQSRREALDKAAASEAAGDAHSR